MKGAIITDTNGTYIEPTLVEDSVTGVFDIRTPQEGEVAQTFLMGYTVAIQAPHGLYQPTFDVESYRQAVQAYEVAYAKYEAELAKRNSEDEDESDADKKPMPEPPPQVDGSSFWRNGLTDEEIEALHVQSQPEPSQTGMLGKELTQMKVRNIQQQSIINGLGTELTKAKLTIMAMSGSGGTNE